jgi:isopenicillin N synthase-like dioxygenase
MQMFAFGLRSRLLPKAVRRPFSSHSINNINIQRLAAGAESEIQKLEESLSGFGFFYISQCGIDDKVVSSIRDHAASLFALPLEIKQGMHIRNSKHFRGWSAVDEEITLGLSDHKVSKY